jgi:small ligand-binding sensory domain FIST
MLSLDPFAAALATGEDALRAAETVGKELARSGSQGTLGFVYVTDKLKADFSAIVECLREHTGVEHWVGTIGFGVIAGRGAVFDKPAIAAMICTWPKDQLDFYDHLSPPPPADEKAFGMPTAIVHVDPRNRQFDTLLRSIATRSGAYLVGGITASRTNHFDQVASRPAEGGLSGVLLSPDIPVSIGVTQGCSPVGPARTITATQENLVLKLDEDAPLQALLKDLAATEESDLRRVLESLHVALPVANCDTGDYVVRNIIGIDTSNGCIAIADNIEPGQKMFFCQRDRTAATKDLSVMAEKLRRRTDQVHGALYISCCARGPHLFESAEEEIALLQTALGNVPLVGFYANGEIAGDRIYGYTGVLALF